MHKDKKSKKDKVRAKIYSIKRIVRGTTSAAIVFGAMITKKSIVQPRLHTEDNHHQIS